jgi:hypothetical protein
MIRLRLRKQKLLPGETKRRMAWRKETYVPVTSRPKASLVRPNEADKLFAVLWPE